jgi:LysR family transcriptional activator of nhaA
MAQSGLGVFAGPEAIADVVCRTYDLTMIGRIPELRERYYAISPDRRLANPALQAITARGRNLFA